MRDRRLRTGLTQGDLAARAGVSRQLVAAVESGRNTPSVEAALRMAGALATTVEELFTSSSSEPVPVLGGELRAGAPVRAGRVGERLVLAALGDHGIAGNGFAKADGVWEQEGLRLHPGATPAGSVLAGCDPAFGVAERLLDGLGPRSVLAVSAPSATALEALERETVHGAVVHGPDGALPDPPVPVVRLHVARWQVGLAVPGAGGRRSLEQLLASQTPIVQRDAAASSQQAFLAACGALGFTERMPGPLAEGHVSAARMASLLRAAAVTIEGAARTFGLRFLALEEHTVELWVAERWFEHPAIQTVAELLASSAFTERVARYGGYDLAGCGSVVAKE